VISILKQTKNECALQDFFKDYCLCRKLSELLPRHLAATLTFSETWQGLLWLNDCGKDKKDQFCSLLLHILQLYICVALLLCRMTSHLSLEDFSRYFEKEKNYLVWFKLIFIKDFRSQKKKKILIGPVKSGLQKEVLLFTYLN